MKRLYVGSVSLVEYLAIKHNTPKVKLTRHSFPPPVLSSQFYRLFSIKNQLESSEGKFASL